MQYTEHELNLIEFDQLEVFVTCTVSYGGDSGHSTDSIPGKKEYM